MSDFRVVIVDGGYDTYARERAVLEPVGATVALEDCRGDVAALRTSVADADAVLIRTTPVDAETIAAMPRCRVMVRYGVGVDSIDLAAARDAGIKVANVPDYGIEEVSDQAVALLLAVNRQISRRDRAMRDGGWDFATPEPVYRLRGATVGIVGYGRIARAFRRKMAGFEPARVLVHDPVLSDWPADVEPADFETICAVADYISLHCPLTPATHHLVDAGVMAAMKPGVVLINTARGGLIDEAALADALDAGQVRGAGIDVFETEPPPRNHPLFDKDNVVLSDHRGWFSEQAIADLQQKAAQEVRRVLEDGDPLNWVNP